MKDFCDRVLGTLFHGCSADRHLILHCTDRRLGQSFRTAFCERARFVECNGGDRRGLFVMCTALDQDEARSFSIIRQRACAVLSTESPGQGRNGCGGGNPRQLAQH